jgi:hypothetical protein
MIQAAPDFTEHPRRRGIAAQVATTLLVGIPMTMGLVVALAAYCTFEYVRFAIFSKPRTSAPPPSPASVDTFTTSLTNLTQIHAAPCQPNVSTKEDSQNVISTNPEKLNYPEPVPSSQKSDSARY